MNEQDHQYRISRRELLARTAKAGVSVAALGGLAAWLYKRPALQFGTVDGSVTMPDFSLPELRGQMAIITGADRTQTVRRGLAALGGIGKFIAKQGRGGIHHLCVEVEDIEATIAAYKAAGIQLIDETPRIGAHNKLVAFVHPKSTGGILLELSQDNS